MSKIDLHKGDYPDNLSKLQKAVKKERDRKMVKMDSLMLEALHFVYGTDINIKELASRGQMNYYSNNSRQFVMDGKVLLEFHNINGTEIFYREYKKIKNDFNEHLAGGCVVESETL